jgi:hypothetical protein
MELNQNRVEWRAMELAVLKLPVDGVNLTSSWFLCLPLYFNPLLKPYGNYMAHLLQQLTALLFVFMCFV